MNNTDVNVLNNVNAEPNLVSDQLNALMCFRSPNSVNTKGYYKGIIKGHDIRQDIIHV